MLKASRPAPSRDEPQSKVDHESAALGVVRDAARPFSQKRFRPRRAQYIRNFLCGELANTKLYDECLNDIVIVSACLQNACETEERRREETRGGATPDRGVAPHESSQTMGC